MKPFTSYSLLAAFAACGLAFGQQAGTTPVGYVTVNVPGNGAVTALSVTLSNSADSAGLASSIQSAALVRDDANWTVNQWQGYLVAIENADGAEESFLVTSNTADTLSISAPFDLTERYSAGAAYRIVQANTIGGLFGNTAEEVPFLTGPASTADLLYLWNGTGYVTYNHNGTSWRKTGSLSSANNDVVYPDEGMFILRRGVTDLTLTFAGEVPAKPQTTTIPGNAQTIVASRFPVGATISSMGYQNLPGWQNGSSSTGDRVFVWNGSGYQTYWYNGTNWRRTGSLSNVDSEVLPDNAFMFVLRVSASDPGQAAAVHQMPYDL